MSSTEDNADEIRSDQRFLKKYRIKLQNEFQLIFKTGVVVSDKTLVIHALATERNYSRIGLSIPKKVGSAPVRNQWKRWMRESFRIQRSELPTGLDLIVRPRKDAEGSFESVSKSMKQIIKKIDLRLRAD